jgi:hypothetical protein
MRQLTLLALGVTVCGFIACNLTTETQVVTGQVARVMDPPLSTATVIIGKASINTPAFTPNPDPWDTSFTPADFPLWLTPTTGATVKVNDQTLHEVVSGIYLDLPDELQFLHRYDLTIDLSGGLVRQLVVQGQGEAEPITAHAVLPDSFSITRPAMSETALYDTFRVSWTRSDSAQAYTVNVAPKDTASRAEGFIQTTTDTSLRVEKTAFEDSTTHQFLPGDYVVAVWAINGGWKSGIDLIRNGGNLKNAVGLYGAAFYPKPVEVRVR